MAAMVTDVLDGIAARALKQFTRIGAIMDPVADKLIGLTALGLLCWSHRLPVWLLYLLLFREACIFSAIAILTRTGHAYAIRPTRFGNTPHPPDLTSPACRLTRPTPYRRGRRVHEINSRFIAGRGAVRRPGHG